MSEWLRKDARALSIIAYQVGLTPEGSIQALQIGARMQAHGFTPFEIDDMIQRQYDRWIADSISGEPTARRRHLRRLRWIQTGQDD